MKKTLYLNCFSGISGDMTLGVLLDLLGREELEPFLDGLALKKLRGKRDPDEEARITGLSARAWTSGGSTHRGLAEIMEIIEKSSIGPGAAARAHEAFRLLADAEAAVHGTSPEKIHFHEPGRRRFHRRYRRGLYPAGSPRPGQGGHLTLNLGSGTVKCAHGEMPVPAPATAKLLGGGRPRLLLGEPMERTTPTGAALRQGFSPRSSVPSRPASS